MRFKALWCSRHPPTPLLVGRDTHDVLLAFYRTSTVFSPGLSSCFPVIESTRPVCVWKGHCGDKHYCLVFFFFFLSNPTQNQLWKTGGRPVEVQPGAVGRIFVPSSTSFHAVPKVPGKLQAGCSHCATEEGWRCVLGGGVMHSVPHTAGLTMKPHYCKLPQFTLSKGAKMDKTTTKKDSLNFWETSSHGLIKLSTCTYHKLYPLCVLMKCYTVLWSVVLLSVRFFPAVGPSRRLSLSNCPWHWLWLLRAQKREVEERERRIITQGTFPQETDINPSPPLSFRFIACLLFSSLYPRGRYIQLLLFCVFFSLFLFCCCSDETFFLMLKMLLVFCHGCSANQLSAVEDESFERSKSRREGELWLVFQQQRCPIWHLGEKRDIIINLKRWVIIFKNFKNASVDQWMTLSLFASPLFCH